MSNFADCPLEQLKEIPFFDAAAWHPGRDIYCLQFFVKGMWHSWIPTPDGLLKMQMWPSESNYLGDAPEQNTDQCFLLAHFTVQHASFPEMQRSHKGIWNDFQNLATSLAKIRCFFQALPKKHEASRFVQTEIEYMVMVCRGVYDLLQEMISAHWERIRLHDTTIKKRKMPKSFADVLFQSSKQRTPEQISSRYGLPLLISQWYCQQFPFFSWLRDLRDRLAHGGNSSVDILFATERGFAIQRSEKPWCDLYDWPKDCEQPNGLVPIRPALCAIVRNVLQTCDSFAHLLQTTIKVPEELFPGLRLYSRGYYDKHLNELDAVIQGALWDDTAADSNEPFLRST